MRTVRVSASACAVSCVGASELRPGVNKRSKVAVAAVAAVLDICPSFRSPVRVPLSVAPQPIVGKGSGAVRAFCPVSGNEKRRATRLAFLGCSL